MVNETFKFLVLLKIYYNFKTVNIFFHKFYHIFKKKSFVCYDYVLLSIV